jgi:VIT1/CCC1 family predicted Fe2+/Mn2+ transporter
MLLAVLILIAAGAYVCIKREVQASSKFTIRGKPALHIGIALILGGLLAVALPAVLNAVGLLRGFVGSLLLSIITMFASLVYTAVIMLAEKRKQAAEGKSPTAPDKT